MHITNINPKNNRVSPVSALDCVINTLNTKGPKAAIAEVHPITPAAFLGESEKIIGYCLKVEAFPTPVKKKINNIMVTNIGN